MNTKAVLGTVFTVMCLMCIGAAVMLTILI